MNNPSPKVIVIAGPNGAGKSTIAEDLVLGKFGIEKYVNADTIARGLAAFAPQSVALEAGRMMLTWIDKLADRRESFAFETTLASRTFCPKIKRWCGHPQGYQFHLFFLWLSSPELAVQRVFTRVSAGGHNVPITDILRRYRRGGYNFKLYQALANTWYIYDHSDKPLLIATGQRNLPPKIHEQERWRQFCEFQNEC